MRDLEKAHVQLSVGTPLTLGCFMHTARTSAKRGTSVHGVTFTWTPTPDPHEAPNPTGCYRRSFDLLPDWCHSSKRLVLCLEGADSAAIVWLNGQWLGYTQDSRLPAEFDATVRHSWALCGSRQHQWERL